MRGGCVTRPARVGLKSTCVPTPFPSYVQPFIHDSSKWAEQVCPVLLLNTETKGSSMLITGSGNVEERAVVGVPLVFELKKGRDASNALLDITIGRTGNNDLVVDDESVSRFHGFFRQDKHTDLWSVTDVGSKNGITVGGVRLVPEKAHLLAAREELVIGSVAMLFLQPETFRLYVDALMKPFSTAPA
jgi:pSer/pThr/pTyr-binding forkhead associated (FHA) protein